MFLAAATCGLGLSHYFGISVMALFTGKVETCFAQMLSVHQ